VSAREDSAGVVVPPPVIYLGGLAVGIVLDVLLDSEPLPGIVRWVLGVLLVLAGAALGSTFMAAFNRARTAVEPWKPTTAIVTTGPYRYTRNPAYLGMALLFAGIALLADAPWALVMLLVVLAIVDRYVIAREERYLERKFGVEYLEFKGRVRRWV